MAKDLVTIAAEIGAVSGFANADVVKIAQQELIIDLLREIRDNTRKV